jgi:hypothetical protein
VEGEGEEKVVVGVRDDVDVVAAAVVVYDGVGVAII